MAVKIEKPEMTTKEAIVNIAKNFVENKAVKDVSSKLQNMMKKATEQEDK